MKISIINFTLALILVGVVFGCWLSAIKSLDKRP